MYKSSGAYVLIPRRRSVLRNISTLRPPPFVLNVVTLFVGIRPPDVILPLGAALSSPVTPTSTFPLLIILPAIHTRLPAFAKATRPRAASAAVSGIHTSPTSGKSPSVVAGAAVEV